MACHKDCCDCHKVLGELLGRLRGVVALTVYHELYALLAEDELDETNGEACMTTTCETPPRWTRSRRERKPGLLKLTPDATSVMRSCPGYACWSSPTLAFEVAALLG